MIPAAPMHPDEFDALLADQTAAAEAAAARYIFQEPTPMTNTLTPARKERMLDFLAGAARVRMAAAQSKRTDAELIAVAVGSRADLGDDVANAAGAVVAARSGALADWPTADVERAAATLEVLRA